MSKLYDTALKAAEDTSAKAHDKNCHELHDLAASNHRIAAEYARQDGDEAAMKKHQDHAEMHGKAAMRCRSEAARVVLNGLASRRMAGNKALEASVKGNGYSFTDLQSEICTELSDLALFKSTHCGPGCWCCDILAPEHEAGETWQAVVSGSDGKLYCVQFKISVDHDVQIQGEPKEVERTSDYDYVSAMETEAKAAGATGLQAAETKRESLLAQIDANNAKIQEAVENFKKVLEKHNWPVINAADFRGNQHQSPGDVADDHSAAARVATRAANAASKSAKDGDKVSQDKAATAHEAARAAHETAAAKQRAAGDEDTAADHDAKAGKHATAKADHAAKMEACQAEDAGDPGENVEAASGNSQPLALECGHASVVLEDGVLMYMPGGTHTITPSQDGEPVTVTVLVDAAAAEKIELQRQKLEAAGKKPFFSIQHETEIAAFWPEKFFYGTRTDSTGAKRDGIWAKGAWTKSGSEAVEGKDFRTFSPTFFVDAIRTDPARPARIVCNEEARANMGALENDPAFSTISPLWARSAGARKVEARDNRALVRACHETLRGSNPSLTQVRRQVFDEHRVWLTLEDVAACL